MLFASGGTGGHLYPALAIAAEIKKLEPRSVLLFVGTSDKIEARVVPQHGYSFRTIWISGFHRAFRMSNLLFPLKVVVSIAQSFFLIKQFKPDVVVGTGGYVCGPILFVASLLGIPTIIHESNSYPGLTTRMLVSRATKVFLTFEASIRWLKRKDNVELVGTPTRPALGSATREESISFFNLDPSKRTVLVFGGSLGAASINEAVLGLLDEAVKKNIQFIWQTGKEEFERIAQRVGNRSIGWMGLFIDRMEYAYGAADVVLCRAGAATLAELTRIGKPAILIPYPFAAADHQTLNATTMVEAKAALMIADNVVRNELAEVLFDVVQNDKKLSALAETCRKLGRPGAGHDIAAKLLQLAN